MHAPLCMSSIDHSHVRTVTDVQWLPSVTFSREGATAQQVTFTSTTFALPGHLMGVPADPIPRRTALCSSRPASCNCDPVLSTDLQQEVLQSKP